MKMDSIGQVLGYYIRNHRRTIAIYSVFILIFAAVFLVYALPLDAVWYALLLSGCFAGVFSVYDFIQFYNKHKILVCMRNQITQDMKNLPFANGLIESDYQDLIDALVEDRRRLSSQADGRQTEMMDYYTLWAHQIKTPISAMRLLLQSRQDEQNAREEYDEHNACEEYDEHNAWEAHNGHNGCDDWPDGLETSDGQTGELLAELFKIEQYVEMVLGYLRIESVTSDLVLQNYRLSGIIRQAVKNYASVFIRKKIILDFKEMECIVLTDEKWMVFVIEQLLSNALKYTNSGKITIHMPDEEKKILWIEDTGIGIEEEDLPRVFEKGFTGYNGRMDKKATGIGLYLCKKILNKLSHKIEISSRPGAGTTVKIDFSTVQTVYE